MQPKEYCLSGEYLPEWLRDFHDQKDFFKAMQMWIDRNQDKKNIAERHMEGHTWCSNHIFAVDFFLWWMGLHGYKLQRIRKKDVDFHDPHQTIDNNLKIISDINTKMLQNSLKSAPDFPVLKEGE